MNQPLVSFCIATYERPDVLAELVEELLSVKDERIEVVVCDDCSVSDNLSRIKKIEDVRLKIFVNKKNVGSAANIYESVDRGTGKYLFYINDKDNVDPFKIPKLLNVLEELERKNVGYAYCVANYTRNSYRIYDAGEEALVRFPCRVTHETGCIFRKEEWDKYKNPIWSRDEKYGDYSHLMATAKPLFYSNGAEIYGDICNITRERIDYRTVRSGYYKGRKDKRLFYTKEVRWRELFICFSYFNEIGVDDDTINKAMLDRYNQYMWFSVVAYGDFLKSPDKTLHYGYTPSLNPLVVFLKSVNNGLYLWYKMKRLFINRDHLYRHKIDVLTKDIYKEYFSRCIQKKKQIIDPIEKRNHTIKYLRFLLDDLATGRHSVSEYLKSLNYKDIAIYGRGVMGVGLCKYLVGEGLNVRYFIDKYKKESEHDNVPVFDPDDELPEADVIFVTVVDEEKDIKIQLQKKVKCPVEEMKDILFVCGQ